MAITIKLHGGTELAAERISGGGYIAGAVGAQILGAPAPAPELRGHYVVMVTYLDGQRGLIAQSEIAAIYDRRGREIDFGHSGYPGHVDYDPRSDRRQEQERQLMEIMNRKMRLAERLWGLQKNEDDLRDQGDDNG